MQFSYLETEPQVLVILTDTLFTVILIHRNTSLDILECSLKHWMEHLVGKVGHFVHWTLETKLGLMMDFSLIPITEGVGDDGPYFAIVETLLEVVELDTDP